MATSKDSSSSDTQTTRKKEAAESASTKTYRLLRGAHSMPAREELTRTEDLPGGGQAEVTYAEGDMVRYVADDPTRDKIELTEGEARRFLFNPAGARLEKPRIEEYKEGKK